MNTQPEIIGIGELVWDMLPAGKQLGGAPVNFAYWCSRSGAKCYPVSAVGNDNPGQEAIERLTSTGLDLSYLQRNGQPTGRVNVRLSGNGIPDYEIVENVAWDAITANDAVLALAARADAVCWGTLAQRSACSRDAITAILEAAGKNCIKVFDINIRKPWYDRDTVLSSLEKADILKLNEDELPLVASMFGIVQQDAEAIAELFRRFSLKHVIYTAGADRSEIHGEDGIISCIPTPHVDVVDTVGAGDSFTAAFVTSLLHGETVAACHRHAVDTAAMVCTQHGAIPDTV